VTQNGKDAFRKCKNPEEFHRSALKLYKEWKAAKLPVGEPIEETETIATAVITYEQAEEQAWNDIAKYLQNMNPYELQKLVASLLRAMGYHVSWVAPPGKDGGVDIIAWNDPLGTRPPRIKV
jgi:restriction system protein